MDVNNHAYFGPEGCLLSSDDSDEGEDDKVASGHPRETKQAVLEQLKNSFAYHKNGPAQEYDWSAEDIDIMTEMIRKAHSETLAAKKNKARVIRAQNHLGESSANMLRNWVNSCLSGQRFPKNRFIKRGPKIEHDQWTNHQMWEYVSETLQFEFRYWSTVEKLNRELPADQKIQAEYPKLEDLIFRHNEDFTAGLWSEFSEFWQPFIDELRYLRSTKSGLKSIF